VLFIIIFGTLSFAAHRACLRHCMEPSVRYQVAVTDNRAACRVASQCHVELVRQLGLVSHGDLHLCAVGYSSVKTASLCWASSVGYRHDATGICCWAPAPAARRPQRARSHRSIGLSLALRALSSKPAARRCCCRSTGQTDGRTDGHSTVT